MHPLFDLFCDELAKLIVAPIIGGKGEPNDNCRRDPGQRKRFRKSNDHSSDDPTPICVAAGSWVRRVFSQAEREKQTWSILTAGSPGTS
jgi:hypothetical protein